LEEHQEEGQEELHLEVAKEDIKREQATADVYEAELVRLQEVDDVEHEKGRSLDDPNKALRKRKEQLLRLMLEQHGKLERYHGERRSAQAALARRAEEFHSGAAAAGRRIAKLRGKASMCEAACLENDAGGKPAFPAGARLTCSGARSSS